MLARECSELEDGFKLKLQYAVKASGLHSGRNLTQTVTQLASMEPLPPFNGTSTLASVDVGHWPALALAGAFSQWRLGAASLLTILR
jgi:hypothetical protein